MRFAFPTGWIGPALVAGLVVLSHLQAAPALAQDARKIGLSLPLGGTAAILGAQFRQGAELAVERIAARGSIELVVTDDGCDADIAELAAADLRSAGVELVTGLLCNDAAYAAARIFAEQRTPLIAAGAQSERLLKDAQREGWRIWRMQPSDAEGALAAFNVLAPRWRGKPWGIVYDGTVYGRAIADEFRARMEEAGQPPQFVENFRPAQTTQAALVRRIVRANVGSLYISASAEDTALVAAALKDANANVEIAGGESLQSLPETQGAADAAGLIAVLREDPFLLPGVRELAPVLKAAGIEPEHYVHLGYAAMQVALAALRPTADETAAALQSTTFQTVLGNIDFNPEGANTQTDFQAYEWTGSEFRPVPVGSR